jgi:ankyrin repeat protein
MLMATVNGHFDLALAILARGGDPNIASHAGTTPLYAAVNTYWAPKARYPQQQAYQQQQATLLDVMEAMLDAGADPNVRLTKHLWFMEYTFSQLRVDTRGATPFWRAAYALDLPAMRLLIEHGADPTVSTMKAPSRRSAFTPAGSQTDPSSLSPVALGGPDVHPIHAVTGHAYGTSFAGVSHRHAPDAWLPAVKYLVEELGADVNARDSNGFSPLHWAASRGDNDVIRYLVEKGADATVISRRGHTTADMANGPYQRITPFPETIALLESLGSRNNNNCVSC